MFDVRHSSEDEKIGRPLARWGTSPGERDVDEGASIADFRAYAFYKTDYVDPPEKWATAQVAFGKLLRDPGATPDRARVPGAADHTVLPRKSNLFRSDVTRIDRDGRQREEPVPGVPAEI